MLDAGTLTEAAYVSMCSEYARVSAARWPWARAPSRVFSGEEPEEVGVGPHAGAASRRDTGAGLGPTRTHSQPTSGHPTAALPIYRTAPGPPTIRPLDLRSVSCPQRDGDDDSHVSPSHGFLPPPPSDGSDSSDDIGRAHSDGTGRAGLGREPSPQARARLRATLDQTPGLGPEDNDGNSGPRPPPISPHLTRSVAADAQLRASVEAWLEATAAPPQPLQPTVSSDELADALAERFFAAATDSSSESDEDE